LEKSKKKFCLFEEPSWCLDLHLHLGLLNRGLEKTQKFWQSLSAARRKIPEQF
jgi:hypothetical protein